MIRLMTEQDIRSVRQVAQASWDETYGSSFPIESLQDWFEKNYSTPMLCKQIEKTHMYVIEEASQIIGFASFTQVDEDGDSELTALYIAPDFKQKGYGTSLVEKGIKVLQDRGLNLFVYVESVNTAARAFYEKLGFELVEEFEEYFEGYPTTTAQYLYPLKTPTLI